MTTSSELFMIVKVNKCFGIEMSLNSFDDYYGKIIRYFFFSEKRYCHSKCIFNEKIFHCKNFTHFLSIQC